MSIIARQESDIVVTGIASDSTVRFASIGTLSTLADPERAVLVADEITAGFVPKEFPRSRIVLVERGESAKCLASLESLYARFHKLELGRNGTVVAVGGGSVSDVAGFAASTWMRGVDFGFVPTTMLAMVDASVGGKNGIDFAGYKNLIGCFSQPRFVLLDRTLLRSLTDFELACGFAEAVKHAIIDGEEHFSLLEGALAKGGTPGNFDGDSLDAVIRSSVSLKARLVNADEKEAGERRKLNLGHTFGHAIESETLLPHGACVAAGLACALRVSERLGNSSAPVSRVVALLERMGLPTGIEGAYKASASARAKSALQFRESVAGALASDKKRQDGSILFAVPKSIGNVTIEAIALDVLRDLARSLP